MVSKRTLLIGALAVCLVVVGFLALAGNAAPSASFAAQVDQSRQIVVVGEGKTNITPDIATINVGVDISAPTVKEATKQSKDTMDKVRKALKDAGIESKDVQTSGYNIYADRSYKEGSPQEVLSYRVSTTFNVTVRDVDKVASVLDAVIEAGANNIYGVNFTAEDTAKAQAEARAKAIKDAEGKAADLARLNKVKVGQVIAISEVIGQTGGSYYSRAMSSSMGMGGGGAGPIEPGQLEYSVQIQVTYAIE